MRRFAENNVNYQERARSFFPGDRVTPYGQSVDLAGRVVAVHPGIGMVDVEFPNGPRRMPAEDLQRFDEDLKVDPPTTDSRPGRVASRSKRAGADWDLLSYLYGLPVIREADFERKGQIRIEWDPRQYKFEDMRILVKDAAASFGFGATDLKLLAPGVGVFSFGPRSLPSATRVASQYKESIYWAGKDRQYRMTRSEQETGPCCPKCEGNVPLKKTIYKRRGGGSEKLLGCPSCLFLIKDADILNFGQTSEVL